MNSRLACLTFLLVAAVLAGCAGGGKPADTSAAATAAAATPNPNAPVLGLSGLEARGVTEADARSVADMLSGELNATGAFRVVDREQTAKMLARELMSTGAFRVVDREQMAQILADKAAKMAGTVEEGAEDAVKLLNARLLGVGSFGMLMGSYVVNFRIVDAETGETRASGTVQGKDLKQLQAGIKDMAVKLAAEKY